MRIYVYISMLAAALSACGGGGGGSSASTSTPDSNSDLTAAASVTAKPLADNKVELRLAGTGLASRFCIRQSNATPLASDPCFSDADSSLKVQQKTLTPSATQPASFTAWLLTGSSVSRHGQVSVAGKTCSQAAYTASSSSALPTVCVITDQGESVLALEPVKAPVTVDNFLRYVNQGFYDQTVFHRFGKVGFGFAQGGGFTHSGSGYVSKSSTQAAIALESTLSSGLSNTAGTISMARTNDPDSATAGFFVNTANNSNSFDSRSNRDGYAVFGSFIYGAGTWTAMVDSITAIPGRSDVTEPTPPIALQWAYQIK